MEQDRTNGRHQPPDDETRRDVANRLRDLGQRIAPAEISDVWVFPPLSHLEGSMEFLLFTRFLPDEMRYLCGAEFAPGSADANGNGHGGNGNGHRNGGTGHGNGVGSATPAPVVDRVRRITEYGAVPSHRVSRVVAGFRERLGDHREPLHFEIAGSEDSWMRLVQQEDQAATD
jgi:hypothetical protein